MTTGRRPRMKRLPRRLASGTRPKECERAYRRFGEGPARPKSLAGFSYLFQVFRGKFNSSPGLQFTGNKFLSNRLLHGFLNRPVQRPSAKLRLPAPFSNKGNKLVVYNQISAFLLQSPNEFFQLKFCHFFELLVVQRMKNYYAVKSIQQFRFEYVSFYYFFNYLGLILSRVLSCLHKIKNQITSSIGSSDNNDVSGTY